MSSRIVMAYSGGLDAAVAVPWLQQQLGGEVVAVTLDLGQGRELEQVRDRALASGALRAHVLDVRDEFARDFVLPSLQAGALRDDRDPMAPALAEPLVARKLVEIAGIEQAGAVAHGGVALASHRLETCLRTLNPELRILAPGREGGVALGRDLPARQYPTGSNLWGRSIEAEAVTDTWTPLPEEIFSTTKRADDAPDNPAYVEISFERGVPVSINGIAMSLTELIESLSIIAGQHGIGRIDVVEDGAQGKVRRIYEAPAAVVLHAAQRALETLALPGELTLLARELGGRYVELVRDGRWFTPTREALDAFFGAMQVRVSGMVRVKLFKGQHSISGRTLAAATAGAYA
jgi:argininosuccinate synthase